MSHDDRPLLSLLSRATERERAALVRRLADEGFRDVTLPGVRILVAVRDEPCSIQQIADRTGTTKQFTAREVRKLAAAKYVLIGASKEDARSASVRIAARGERLLEASARVKRALDAAVRRTLGERDAAELHRLLARLVDQADATERSG